MHQVPDETLADMLPVAKKVALALGPQNYNILQNNGRLAHQEVDHVHFHIIPKDEAGGLGIKWTTKQPSQDELKELCSSLVEKISKL
ncbi:hypothetical protein HK103_004215 [Boothiomyces macroporosus]|uniref:HIT domain-containing protein n=1 Tax=Boothiomyces macroporosus TaxID=261099 RepID=A0AAD5UJJ0_9FUNG|nr:hypothetical protein HK103_004215 [Boothiomyces macroporosus]